MVVDYTDGELSAKGNPVAVGRFRTYDLSRDLCDDGPDPINRDCVDRVDTCREAPAIWRYSPAEAQAGF